MVNVSVTNLKRIEIADASGTAFCGGWQQWYDRPWKRIAGCGPTVISGILLYLNRSRNDGDTDTPPFPKNKFQALMEEVWHYVTPGVRGLPSPSALTKGARTYLENKNLPYIIEELEVPKSKWLRPDFTAVISFLDSALRTDTPVAFLSLDNGAEKRLDSWHWVTLLSLQYEQDGSFAEAGVADEGRHFQADLRKWYYSTELGGGFVRFRKK